MIYKVTARFIDSKATEFYQKLTDGSIQNQKPDGPEMVNSMHRASIQESGLMMWSELCYCDPPLAHERSTVLDSYFTDFATKHDEAKLIDIVRKTWRKMSPRGHEAALALTLEPALRTIVERALSGSDE